MIVSYECTEDCPMILCEEGECDCCKSVMVGHLRRKFSWVCHELCRKEQIAEAVNKRRESTRVGILVGDPGGGEVGTPVGGPVGGEVGTSVGGPVGGEVGVPVDGPVGGEVGTPRG
jgi:hypothetical protein